MVRTGGTGKVAGFEVAWNVLFTLAVIFSFDQEGVGRVVFTLFQLITFSVAIVSCTIDLPVIVS